VHVPHAPPSVLATWTNDIFRLENVAPEALALLCPLIMQDDTRHSVTVTRPSELSQARLTDRIAVCLTDRTTVCQDISPIRVVNLILDSDLLHYPDPGDHDRASARQARAVRADDGAKWLAKLKQRQCRAAAPCPWQAARAQGLLVTVRR
jgi:hypothetical protein